MNKYCLLHNRLLCGLQNMLSYIDRCVLCFLFTGCYIPFFKRNRDINLDEERIEMD